VNIRRLVEEVTWLVGVEVNLNSEVVFLKNIAADVPETFVSDYRRLKQVLINLIRNSVKFTRKGRIVLQVQKKRIVYSKNDEIVAI
jgi:signal transduction histidine kinase